MNRNFLFIAIERLFFKALVVAVKIKIYKVSQTLNLDSSAFIFKSKGRGLNFGPSVFI